MQAEEYGKFTRIVFDTAPTVSPRVVLSMDRCPRQATRGFARPRSVILNTVHCTMNIVVTVCVYIYIVSTVLRAMWLVLFSSGAHSAPSLPSRLPGRLHWKDS